MPLEPACWIRWLFRVAGFRVSEAELGDMQEEYASGNRSAFWLVRQILSASRHLVGVYGVVSYVVSRRRREVGIRLALGATARDGQHLIVRQIFRPIGIGAVIGIVAASAASRALENALFGISPFDPIAFIAAALFLVGVAEVATVLPIRGALKVDPANTLRYE